MQIAVKTEISSELWIKINIGKDRNKIESDNAYANEQNNEMRRKTKQNKKVKTNSIHISLNEIVLINVHFNFIHFQLRQTVSEAYNSVNASFAI